MKGLRPGSAGLELRDVNAIDIRKAARFFFGTDLGPGAARAPSFPGERG